MYGEGLELDYYKKLELVAFTIKMILTYLNMYLYFNSAILFGTYVS